MNERVIVTKGQTIEIPDGAEGVPVEVYFGTDNLPESIKGALVYELPQGRFIALQND